MEQYKEKLKITRRIITVAALILTACCILFVLSECGIINIAPNAGDVHWQSRWRGMICGASFGLSIFLFAWTIRISKALRSDKELKKLYVEANDERQEKIRTAAGSSATQIFLIVGLVAAIVAGYFSVAVGTTILACLFIHSMIVVGCSMYFNMKF